MNFQSSSGTTSGPSDRSYDLFVGAHSTIDSYDIPQYIAPAVRPGCSANVQSFATSGTMQSTANRTVSICTSSTPTMNPASSQASVTFPRLAYAMYQCGGLNWIPTALLQSTVLSQPYRLVEQRYGPLLGQERSNFFAPGYSIGFSGEDAYASATSVAFTGRLGGAPADGHPVAQVASAEGGPTRALSYLRIFCENNDNPFYLQSTYAAAGNNMQLPFRSVAVQHQGFILMTGMLGPLHYQDFTDEFTNAPWNTNIVLPLGADALYAGSVLLPITANSAMSLPLNTIFTIRHKANSFIVRLLRAERSSSSNITDATTIQAYTNVTNIQPGVGLQQYSLMWQVDASSIKQGVGRLVIHQSENDSNSDRHACRARGRVNDVLPSRWLTGGLL